MTPERKYLRQSINELANLRIDFYQQVEIVVKNILRACPNQKLDFSVKHRPCYIEEINRGSKCDITSAKIESIWLSDETIECRTSYDEQIIETRHDGLLGTIFPKTEVSYISMNPSHGLDWDNVQYSIFNLLDAIHDQLKDNEQ